MDILAIQPYGDAPGHFGSYAARICQELAKLEHRVVLCTSYLDSRHLLSEPAQFELRALGPRFASSLPHHTRGIVPPLWGMIRIRNTVATMRLALDVARRDHFDVAQIFSYELLSMWAVLTTSRGVLPPAVLEVSAPNYAASAYPGNVFAKAWKLLQTWALRAMLGNQIHAIDVNSESHIPLLRHQLSLPPSFPVRLASDGRQILAGNLDQSAARRLLELDDSPAPLFVCFGILRADKGLEHLLKALSLLPQESCRLLIAGAPTDWRPEQLRRVIGELGLSDRVTLHLGFVPEHEVPTYFSAADGVILPYRSTYAGSSGPLYDAAAHGKPVIVTAVSEMGRLVRSHGFGLVAEPDNAAALASAIQRFLHLMPEERESLTERALDFARHHTPETIARRYIAIYEEVLMKTRQAPRTPLGPSIHSPTLAD